MKSALVAILVGVLGQLNTAADPMRELNVNDVYYMAKNVYHEARGDSMRGQAAVAHVVLNRVRSEEFPDSIEDVIFQPKQFSWANGGRRPAIREEEAWERAVEVAAKVMLGEIEDETDGAQYFYAPRGVAGSPAWARRFTETARIDNHLFYRKGPAPSEVILAKGPDALDDLPQPERKPRLPRPEVLAFNNVHTGWNSVIHR